jgi:hypothetical protein
LQTGARSACPPNLIRNRSLASKPAQLREPMPIGALAAKKVFADPCPGHVMSNCGKTRPVNPALQAR